MRRIIGAMIRAAAAVLSLLFAFTSLAQTSDLRVTIAAPATARVGDVVTATAVVENIGDAVAPNVRASIRIIPGSQCDEPNLLLGDLAPGEQRVLTCSQEVIDLGMFYLRSNAGADSNPPERDALRANNFAVAFTDRITEGTELGLGLGQLPRAARPGLPFALPFFYWNASRTPATHATLTVTLSEGSFAGLPAGCTSEGNRAVCALGSVRPSPDRDSGESHVFTVNAVAPDRSDFPFTVEAVLSADEPDEKPANNTIRHSLETYQTFYVREATERALREALSAVGSECPRGPCLVAFRIPVTAETKWHTIRLTAPLEPVRGFVVEIDGTTQTGYFGDTNPEGPEIELDGSSLAAGDGLVLPAGCGFTVRGLTLNGFPQSAILLHEPQDGRCHVQRLPTNIEQNYIGTDPTGTSARPNERGIFAASRFEFTAERNVISGNRRTGVYVERGQGEIRRNVIGLNRTHDAPLPNGASGVYVAAQGRGTDVDDNYIGFNAHFGVAIDRGADHVALFGNSFQANGGAPIDWGLDGTEAGGRVPAPAIRGVTYAEGVTTIEVDPPSAPSGQFAPFPFFSFYASDSPDDPEGQYFLGTIAEGARRIQVPLDLRSKWVTATLTERVYLTFVRTHEETPNYTTTTSEMSRARLVE